MNVKRCLRRLAKGLAVLGMLLSMVTATVSAAAQIDTGRRGSLSVYFGEGGEDFAGVEFSIYRVASVSASGIYTLTGDFADYPVTVNNLTSSGWRALAQTLEAYVSRDGLRPLDTEETDRSGWAEFRQLRTGLYLVSGEQYADGDTVYTPEPMLVSLPGQDEDGEWEYHVEAICKYDEDSEPPSDDTVRRKVLKIWDDSGNRDQRPAYVRVQLLRNGRVVDTVRLSEDNNWQYTWNDLDADARWQVVEDQVPDGYTVSIDREGITFVITNTYPPEEPDRPPRPDEPEEPDEPDEPHLTQTGQLWWPVWALGFCGGAMIAAGLLVRHRRHDNES